MWEAVYSYLSRMVGNRTDAADPAGSLHAKLRRLGGAIASLSLLNDGADGSFSPTANTQLASGIYRYTTINIPSGVTVSCADSYGFLVLLATGAVTIDGLLTVSGKGGLGGAAVTASTSSGGNAGSDGFGNCGSGGAGGSTPNDTVLGGKGGNTDFPGGNAVTWNNGSPGVSALRFGKLSFDLRTLFAFRGAGGGSGVTVSQAETVTSGAGGNGGGVVIVLSNKSISGTGAIRADGLNGGNGTASGAAGSGGGGGGGGGLAGAIAPIITIATVSAAQGLGGSGAAGSSWRGSNGGNGGDGFAFRITI